MASRWSFFLTRPWWFITLKRLSTTWVYDKNIKMNTNFTPLIWAGLIQSNLCECAPTQRISVSIWCPFLFSLSALLSVCYVCCIKMRSSCVSVTCVCIQKEMLHQWELILSVFYWSNIIKCFFGMVIKSDFVSLLTR